MKLAHRVRVTEHTTRAYRVLQRIKWEQWRRSSFPCHLLNSDFPFQLRHNIAKPRRLLNMVADADIFHFFMYLSPEENKKLQLCHRTVALAGSGNKKTTISPINIKKGQIGNASFRNCMFGWLVSRVCDCCSFACSSFLLPFSSRKRSDDDDDLQSFLPP